ncbi:MAG: hypothetical protein AVDCRST_MAG54-4187 [uncultured Actinomycetospora sp.]|uniref:Uncharacterized protein n=1 Tax=uncultured Actinomycetospora sp. TaxID=1135996 RepID=A0A6J4JUV3_9PSEU|nr:MAG: hypothetical protein AVDCRST_MAG54-4187 [uncultured Actinomycetospora sp.]
MSSDLHHLEPRPRDPAPRGAVDHGITPTSSPGKYFPNRAVGGEATRG